jgi:tRNA(fMet)-specific endonuclease VapC
MTPALLDTDILSAIMRRNPTVIPYAQSYLAAHRCFTISIITRYEILRGLKAKRADKQLIAFNHFCSLNKIITITEEIITTAADIYADLYRNGLLIGDADILIAATALTHDLLLVTNNVNHLGRINGLKIINWLNPKS